MGDLVELIFEPNIEKREKSSIDPIMECIYKKLILILENNYIYRSVIEQMTNKTFEYISQSAVATLISNPNYCTTKMGLRIKMNICQFEFWISSKLSRSSLLPLLVHSISFVYLFFVIQFYF